MKAVGRVVTWVTIVFGLSSPAHAQVATSFDELRTMVKTGDTLHITEFGGRKTKGKLANLASSSLELQVLRTDRRAPDAWMPQHISEADITEILVERPDSLWNGTIIGLGAGAAAGALIGLAAASSTDAYSGDPGGAAGMMALGVLFVAGVGAATGVLVDLAVKQRPTVYLRASKRSAGLQVFPVVSISGARALMSFRF